MERIYLDHAATTPLHPLVLNKMTEVQKTTFGNPSSIHSFGRESRKQLDDARSILAKSIGANPDEIVFTSGGTEADNLAILGTAQAKKSLGKHIITTKIEHHAVLHTCQYLEKEGFEVTYLSPDDKGEISLDSVKAALRPDTILVTIMYGNNEVGSLQPIKEIASLLEAHQAIFHTDAVQAYGVKSIDVTELGVDLLSVTAHKVSGPKGIGFLYIKTDTGITSLTYGGEQERKRRAGTENLPAIVGFSEAVLLAMEGLEKKVEFFRHLKDTLIKALESEQIDWSINGAENSLPHILNISFPKTDVESLLVNLDLVGIAASSGSACTAGSVEPSHVLVAMFGSNSDRIRNSIRFSFGIDNTEEQIVKAGKEIAKIVRRFQN
ncbi:cysteine desulfurase family protein [Lederbergia galactosidilytica]|uniref:cysteine desulfurase n=1 Tax=Lederbergia galactosidilytica TaxID=217031 RepID=A0A178A3T7_9BACI|nr:cysteine desulfurase family protein [Lederbergia galactosidilytica]MBP1914876.1 cysteine desulfurase [Lederbergia galactosidilytica]OAK74170.1 cysteine desulfurase [Lederbergia galactosidilytica]